MKTKHFFLLMITGLFTFSLLLSSCSKEDDNNVSEDLSATEDNAIAERLFDNVSNIADEAYSLGSNYKSTENNRVLVGDCATVTLDTTSSPRVLTIDFGTENCLCPDGRYRRGKIIVTFTGRYYQEGTVITHSFDEYFVNDHQVLGSKVVTNAGRNEMDNMYFIIEVLGQVIKPNGSQFSWVAYREREWVEGEGTPWIRDNVYHITGHVDGVTVHGKTYNMTIINPLRRELDCRYLVSGTYEFTPEDRPTRIVDYGTGACDNIATVTVNGNTWTIYLR